MNRESDGAKERGRVWHIANGLARFAPGAVISIVLFTVLSGILYALIQLGASESTIQKVAGITSFIGIFAVLGSFVLLGLAIVWVIDDDL